MWSSRLCPDVSSLKLFCLPGSWVRLPWGPIASMGSRLMEEQPQTLAPPCTMPFATELCSFLSFRLWTRFSQLDASDSFNGKDLGAAASAAATTLCTSAVAWIAVCWRMRDVQGKAIQPTPSRTALSQPTPWHWRSARSEMILAPWGESYYFCCTTWHGVWYACFFPPRCGH